MSTLKITSDTLNEQASGASMSPIKALLNWFRSDPRHYQVSFQLTFLLYGIFGLGWDIPLVRFNLIILTSLAVQAIFIQLTTKDWSGLKSALITSFSLCLMLQANSTWTFLLAAALGISSKFLIRIRKKHFFNPANFGMVITMFLTGDAWLSPGQWGSDGLLVFLVGCAGLLVLYRVKRLDTAFAFLLGFLGFSFARNILFLGWPVDFFVHQLQTGSLLLFAFFMITDPMATPASRPVRIIWAFCVGLFSFWLSYKQFIHTAPIFALFFMSMLVPVLDYFFAGERFVWQTNNKQVDTTTN
jgi:Na+-transporting NADH:ubiquinone oxidoreductase subunit NqrB